MTYDEIISWIRDRYSDEGYDIFSLDDISNIRQQLISDYDKDGRLRHFIEGNPKSTRHMTEQGRFRWTGIEGTRVESQLFEEAERPIIDELNRDIEQQLSGQIGEADTIGEIDEIDIPDNLMPEVIERLEGTRTERFGELKGEELKREIESPDTEVSRFKQLIKEVRKLPDEDIGRELEKEIKGEGKRLGELNQFFLQEIRSARSEPELENALTRLGDSDLRGRQKDALRRIGEARRNLGFPEVGEI